MAKIAVRAEHGAPPRARVVASGDGWSVSEVVCGLGPRDRAFEEQHCSVTIAMVTAGTFEYRSRKGRHTMTPGSLLLGGVGECFECGHEYGTGDRCVSFAYSPEIFDGLEVPPVFRSARVSPVRELSPLIARASAAIDAATEISWHELSIELAARTAQVDCEPVREPAVTAGAIARVSRVLRRIESDQESSCDLVGLAREARMSPYHFLRTFRSVAGVTPHQYILRMRLRRAAARLRMEPSKIVEIALESGFGDVSNFNRMFRAEFGVSPRMWRTREAA